MGEILAEEAFALGSLTSVLLQQEDLTLLDPIDLSTKSIDVDGLAPGMTMRITVEGVR